MRSESESGVSKTINTQYKPTFATNFVLGSPSSELARKYHRLMKYCTTVCSGISLSCDIKFFEIEKCIAKQW